MQSFIASLLPNASLYEAGFGEDFSSSRLCCGQALTYLILLVLILPCWRYLGQIQRVSDAHRAECRGRFVVTANRKQWRL